MDERAAEQERGHKWFAAMYDRMMASAERSFMKPVREEIAGGASGRVLEVGAGTGANFPYYREGIEVSATEPDPFMLEKAEARARTAGRAIELKRAPAEALPFDDESFDAVVCTLVLCTVRDPEKALAEIRRVLKPQGQYRFYEHVRYEHAFGAFWQDLATPIWRWFGAGCHPNRDTARSIREAGFVIQEVELLKPLPPLPPMVFSRPHIKGIALRP
ncbi:MAG TPA: class I SAM-dependent methyltransferase [Dehalococcoidia bacterium]|nr:class I SAM-dependent methyltransferase [Dehalococcoidia bacterium]